MPTLNPYPQPLTPYPNPLAAPQVRALRLWVAALRVARIYLRTIRPLHTRVVQRRRATLLYLPCISPVSPLYLPISPCISPISHGQARCREGELAHSLYLP